MTRSSWTVLLVVAALVAVSVGGCSDDGGSSSSGDLGAGVVAQVGDQEIGEQEIARQVDALTRAQRPAGKEPPETTKRQLRDQALTVVLMREAIEQEAAERGIEVSKAEVAQRWRAVSRDQFKTKRALRRFLGGQTEQDVLDQLRLQTLSERINEQVAEEAGGGKKGTQAVKRFQEEFRKSWADKTTCADGYAAAGCDSE